MKSKEVLVEASASFVVFTTGTIFILVGCMRLMTAARGGGGGGGGSGGVYSVSFFLVRRECCNV